MVVITIPYTPHKGQLPFHKSTAKFRAIISGVAFGKTAAGANEFLKMAINHPKALHLIMAPNGKIMQHATLTEIYKFGRKLIIAERKSKNLIYLLGGAKIVYLTADNARHIDRLRGITLGSFWADEGCLFLRQIWNVMLARLRSPYGPLKGIITTTPKGYDWLYWYFAMKSDPVSKRKLKNANQYEWFGGTTMDNPYTPEEFKQTLLDQYTGMFKKQEIYGEFIGFEGQVYSKFNRETHVIKQAPETFSDMIYGVDWGFSNKMACTIIGFDSDGRAYIIDEFYQSGVQVETLIQWIIEKKKEYKELNRGYADPSEPQNIVKFNRQALNLSAADNSIMPGINAVYDHIEVRKDGRPRLFVLETCLNTLDEFGLYRYPETREGVPKQEKPLKVDDHLMDAIRYALKTHNFGSKGYGILEDPKGILFKRKRGTLLNR